MKVEILLSVTQIITIDDTIDPTITCPADITVECIGDVPAADINLVTAADNCGNVTVTHVGDVSDGGSCPETITRTYRATDDCGNFTDCTQTITIDDTIDPTITCPADITVECIGDVPAADINLVTAADNCGNVTVTHVGDVSDGGSCPETITRTYRATDDCGNFTDCTQTITIDDTIDPTITCPADITVECIGDVPAQTLSAVTATDNCTANPTITFISDVSDGDTCPEVITRTYQAEDDCGNIATCTQIITIDDTIAASNYLSCSITVECIGDVPANDIICCNGYRQLHSKPNYYIHLGRFRREYMS